jgi:hypothetical protein
MTDEEREQEEGPTAGTVPEEEGDTGSEGNTGSPDADTLPGAPSGDDDSALGDTDQHSEA